MAVVKNMEKTANKSERRGEKKKNMNKKKKKKKKKRRGRKEEEEKKKEMKAVKEGKDKRQCESEEDKQTIPRK